jgi:hypothetical protein
MIEGTIITTTVNVPGVKHLGISILINNEIYIVHNSPGSKNIFGGNVIVEPYSNFLIGRKIKSFQNTYLTTDHIINKTFDVSSIKFDSVTFNCEHFIQYVSNGLIEANQASYVKFKIAIIILGSLLLIK